MILVNLLSEKYIKLFENITGDKFQKSSYDNKLKMIQNSIENYFSYK